MLDISMHRARRASTHDFCVCYGALFHILLPACPNTLEIITWSYKYLHQMPKFFLYHISTGITIKNMHSRSCHQKDNRYTATLFTSNQKW